MQICGALQLGRPTAPSPERHYMVADRPLPVNSPTIVHAPPQHPTPGSVQGVFCFDLFMASLTLSSVFWAFPAA
jgi:hypothetical protein